MAIYDFKADFQLYSGGYTGEITGCEGGDIDWQPGDSMTGTRTATYYYRDTNRIDIPASQYNQYSSEVRVTVKDTWTVKRLADNTLEISLDTDIIDVWRYLPTGNGVPTYSGAPWWRNLVLYTELEDARNQRNSISGNLYRNWNVDDYTHKPAIMNIPTRTIRLAPGDTSARSSIFAHNWAQSTTQNFWHDPAEKDGYNDSMGIGVMFRNNLPKDFPHKIVYHYGNPAGQTSVDEWRDLNQTTTRTVGAMIPKRTHWIFKGWSKQQGSKTVEYHAGDTIFVGEEVDLYAVWEYTYRPGMHKRSGGWYSLDIDGSSVNSKHGGACRHYVNGEWRPMRTQTNIQGLSNPPAHKQADGWYSQSLIGKGGKPHDVSW